MLQKIKKSMSHKQELNDFMRGQSGENVVDICVSFASNISRTFQDCSACMKTVCWLRSFYYEFFFLWATETLRTLLPQDHAVVMCADFNFQLSFWNRQGFQREIKFTQEQKKKMGSFKFQTEYEILIYKD